MMAKIIGSAVKDALFFITCWGISAILVWLLCITEGIYRVVAGATFVYLQIIVAIAAASLFNEQVKHRAELEEIEEEISNF